MACTTRTTRAGSRPIFGIHPGNGTLFLAAPLTYQYADLHYFVGNIRARAAYTANVSACDAGVPPQCTNASVTLIVVANYSAPLIPTIKSSDIRTDFYDTRGGEAERAGSEGGRV